MRRKRLLLGQHGLLTGTVFLSRESALHNDDNMDRQETPEPKHSHQDHVMPHVIARDLLAPHRPSSLLPPASPQAGQQCVVFRRYHGYIARQQRFFPL